MSVFSYVMSFLQKGTTSALCPVCGKRSPQPSSKIANEQTMVCQHCKSLFTLHKNSK